jgi:ubiquinone/menaquinone biosynthesis C-methylase UbiE
MLSYERNAEWFERYSRARGKDRQDLRTNKGVLFQTLAFDVSVIRALYWLDVDCDSAKVLDVGCGTGASLERLLRLGFRPANLKGIDLQNECIDQAKALFPNIGFTHGDAAELQFLDGSFDIVIESTLLMSVAEDSVRRKIAAEMIRVCRPGGYIVLIDWRISNPFSNPYNYKGIDCREVRKLFGVGSLTRPVRTCRGALLPPIGRFLSKYMSSIYFLVARLFPALVGQVTYVLTKS